MKFRRRAILSVGLVALFAATALTFAWGQTSELDVLVLDPSGAAITFAEIVVRDDAGDKIASGSTNGSGGFDLRNVRPGAYEVVARALGFEAHTETVVIPEGTVTKFVVNLAVSPDAPKSGLDVLLTDFSGAVIPNVQILVENQDRIKIVSGTTTMAGGIRFAGLTPGTYVLSTRPPGFKALQDAVTVLPNQMAGVRLTLQVGNPPYPVDHYPYYPDPPWLVEAEAFSPYALIPLIPELKVPKPPRPAPQEQSPHHNRFRRFFSTLGNKLGL
jgi:hypothetical protein